MSLKRSNDEPDTTSVKLTASSGDGDDDDWRYIRGPTQTIYTIHHGILKQKAPNCYVIKELTNGKGKTLTDPHFLSVPTWYLEAVCDFAQKYSASGITFKETDAIVEEILTDLEWTESGDLPLSMNIATSIEMKKFNNHVTLRNKKALELIKKLISVRDAKLVDRQEPGVVVLTYVINETFGIDDKTAKDELLKIFEHCQSLGILKSEQDGKILYEYNIAYVAIGLRLLHIMVRKFD